MQSNLHTEPVAEGVRSCLRCDAVQSGTSVPMYHTDVVLHLAEYTASHLRTL